MTAPSESSISTRERVLAVAHALIDTEGPGVPLTRIAAAAGVSRQTVYDLFGDRIGLFRALWSWTLSDRSRSPQRSVSELEKHPPLEQFERLYRGWIRQAIKVEKTMRPLWTTDGDADLMTMLKEADDGAMQVYRLVFRSLRKAGLLRDIWTPEEAADTCWQHALYLVFVGYVRRMRPWTPEEIEERGMKMLRAAFLTEAAAKKAAKIEVP